MAAQYDPNISSGVYRFGAPQTDPSGQTDMAQLNNSWAVKPVTTYFPQQAQSNIPSGVYRFGQPMTDPSQAAPDYNYNPTTASYDWNTTNNPSTSGQNSTIPSGVYRFGQPQTDPSQGASTGAATTTATGGGTASTARAPATTYDAVGPSASRGNMDYNNLPNTVSNTGSYPSANNNYNGYGSLVANNDAALAGQGGRLPSGFVAEKTDMVGPGSSTWGAAQDAQARGVTNMLADPTRWGGAGTVIYPTSGNPIPATGGGTTGITGGTGGTSGTGTGTGGNGPTQGGYYASMANDYPQLGSALTNLLGPLAPYVDAATSGMKSAYEQTKANNDIGIQSRFADAGSYLSSPMFAYQGQQDANLAAQYLSSLGQLQTAAASSQAQRGSDTANNLVNNFTNRVNQLTQSGASIETATISALAQMFGSSQAAGASMYGADKSAGASMYGSDQARTASMYGSNQSASASMYGSDRAAQSSQYGTEGQMFGDMLRYNLGMAGINQAGTDTLLQFITNASAQQLAGQDQQFNQSLRLALASQGIDQAALDKLYAAYGVPGTNALDLLKVLSGIQDVSNTTNPGIGSSILGNLASGAGNAAGGGASNFLSGLSNYIWGGSQQPISTTGTF